MTPRALLSVIGATAIAFAVAIGNAGGFAINSATTSSITSSQDMAAQNGQLAIDATPGTQLARAGMAPRPASLVDRRLHIRAVINGGRQ